MKIDILLAALKIPAVYVFQANTLSYTTTIYVHVFVQKHCNNVLLYAFFSWSTRMYSETPLSESSN